MATGTTRRASRATWFWRLLMTAILTGGLAATAGGDDSDTATGTHPIPPIDADVPERYETATFAMG